MMKAFFRDKSLLQQFTISLALIIFIPIVITGIYYHRSSKQVEGLVTRLLEQVVENVNSQLDMIYDESSSLSLQIAGKAQVRNFVTLEQDNYYEKLVFKEWIEKSTILEELFLRSPIIDSIKIVGDNGIIYSAENNKYLDRISYGTKEDQVVKRAAFFKENLRSDGSVEVFTSKASNISNGDSSDTKFISMARRIFSKSMITSGTIVIDINASSLNMIWKNTDIEEGYIWVIDKNGQIIYHPDFNKIGMSENDLIPPGSIANSRGSFISSIGEEKYFNVYNISRNTGWKVVSTIPVSNFNAPIVNLRNVIFYTCLIGFPLSILIGYLLIIYIIKPIRKLQSSMKKNRDGNWQVITGNIPRNEIGDLMLVYNKMILKISEMIETVYKTELERKKNELTRQKAELQALQSQINPHFLYNTLGTINAYAIVADETQIQEMTEALSNMFRYSVQNSLEPVRLADEVEHVKNYLLIQSYRQKQMPKIIWNIEDYLDNPVLRLTLQPLIENIFHHAFPDGIKQTDTITLSAGLEDGVFILYVKDSGVGLSMQDSKSLDEGRKNIKRGIGLKNVNRRLQLAYGEEYGLEIYSEEGTVTTVRVKIPTSGVKINFEL